MLSRMYERWAAAQGFTSKVRAHDTPAWARAAERGALEVGPAAAAAAAAADGKSEGYTGADEAHKVEHEREVLPEDEKAVKPASYFNLYRCRGAAGRGGLTCGWWVLKCAGILAGRTHPATLPPQAAGS